MDSRTEEALGHVDDSALLQAVEHHRRAVEALDSIHFEIASTSSDDVVRRLRDDLSKLEKELMRRGLAA